MQKALALTALAPLLLIGAAYPSDDKADPVDEMTYAEPVPGPVTYRPCRPGPGDDRCIQLYERGVRAAYARWQREHDAPARLAMGGPVEARAHATRTSRRAASRRCPDHDSADHQARHDREDPAYEDAPAGAPEQDEDYGGETRGM